MKYILLSLILTATALADPLSGIVIAKNKTGQIEATWQGSHKPAPGDPQPMDEHVAALAAHPEIEVLSFDGQMGGTAGLTGQGLAALTELPKLSEIRMNGINTANMRNPGGAVPVGPAGFAAMAKMPHLRVLYIQHAHLAVKDAALLLRTSKSLEEFTPGTVFCDELLEAAAQAPNLKKFSFGHWDNIPKDAPLTLTGYALLAQMKKLESLSTGIRQPKDVPWIKLTSILGSIPTLRSLGFACGEDEIKRKKTDPGPTPMTAEDLMPLTKLPALTELGLWHSTFAPGALIALQSCRSLKTLTLRGDKFDEADALALKQALPTLTILIVEGQPVKQRKL